MKYFTVRPAYAPLPQHAQHPRGPQVWSEATEFENRNPAARLNTHRAALYQEQIAHHWHIGAAAVLSEATELSTVVTAGSALIRVIMEADDRQPSILVCSCHAQSIAGVLGGFSCLSTPLPGCASLARPGKPLRRRLIPSLSSTPCGRSSLMRGRTHQHATDLKRG